MTTPSNDAVDAAHECQAALRVLIRQLYVSMKACAINPNPNTLLEAVKDARELEKASRRAVSELEVTYTMMTGQFPG